MVKFMILSSVVVLLVASLSAVQGLECYHCYDVDVIPKEIFEKLQAPYNPLANVEWKALKSCKTEGENKLTCKSNITNPAGKEAKVVCATMTLNIDTKNTTVEIPGVANITGTFGATARGCLYVDTDVEPLESTDCVEHKNNATEKFSNYTLGPIKDLLDGKGFPDLSQEEDEMDVILNVCPCSGDNCNPASAVSHGVLSLLATLLVLPFTLR